MGSDSISDRAGNSQDLRDLQDTYRKRRQQIEEEGQAELTKARKSNAERLRNENENSEAAINHVRSANKERLDQVKQDTEQKLTYERSASARSLQSQREHDKAELAAVEDGVKSREQQLDYNIRQQYLRENALRARESEATNLIAQEQNERRAKIMGQEQKSLSEFGEKVQRRKAELNAKAKDEVAQLTDRHHNEMARLAEQQRQTFAKQKQYTDAEIKNQREQQQRNLTSEREQFTQNELNQRTRASEELHHEQDNATAKLQEVRHENQIAADRAKQRGVDNMEKTRSYYDRNIAAIEKKGDAKINEQTEMQTSRIRQMEEQNKTQLEEAKSQHQAELEQNHQLYMNQSTNNKEFYRKSLIGQKVEYDRAFKQNIESFQQQVGDQRARLNDSLVREKREVMEDVGKYNSKNKDPFYRIVNPKTALRETRDHYILEAKVPEHEKDNVKVVVHGDKVVVQGRREFADGIEDPNTKIETHNYQTYRQEIPLEHPVRDKFAQKSYANGILKIKIPKA